MMAAEKNGENPKIALEEGCEFLPQFEKRGGLLPAIVQDADTREILMLGWVNSQALTMTLESGKASFWSTSRNELWVKGATSGDYLDVLEIRVDCDQDALIYLVRPRGQGACHTKDVGGKARYSCFYRRIPLDSNLKTGGFVAKDKGEGTHASKTAIKTRESLPYVDLVFLDLNKKNEVNKQ